MATPYAPSQLNLANFDATQSATATWSFSSSDSTVTQGSFDLQIYNNSNNTLVLDTGWVTSSLTQYTIPANTLVNRTQYKWRVQYKDSNGNASAWSSYQVFTCSSYPTVTLTNPTASQSIASNVLTLTATYSQAQSVTEQSYRFIVFGSDQLTIIQDSGTVYNTANQFTVSGLSNGNYYAQVIMVSSDGLQTSSAKISFTISYSGSSQASSISTTPLQSNASLRIDWQTPISIPGNYIGSGITYKAGKWSQAVQISALGEKVYWTIPNTFNQFTYTSWWIPNLNSSSMKNNQVIAKLMNDKNNYLQIRYDPASQAFIFEKCVNGSSITTKSSTGITFSAGSQLFVAIKQYQSTTAYIGVGGTFYTITFPSGSTSTSNDYGVGTYGSAVYTSNITGIPSLKTVYIGCSDVDGNEANALFDQTHLTSNIMSDSTIQNLYTNSTLQQYTIQSMFLANFDGTLDGGTSNGITIDHWNVTRVYNGVSKTLGNVTNTGQTTATFTDITPLAGIQYQYNVVPIDSSGNIGTSQSINGSVTFDGWWLYDSITNSSFQFMYNIEDMAIKRNYKRTVYETFGQYPIIAYSPMKYRDGKLVGLITDSTGTQTPLQLAQQLFAITDNHHQLLLRGSDGTGMIVDCYDPTRTISDPTSLYFNKMELSWTEVASI